MRLVILMKKLVLQCFAIIYTRKCLLYRIASFWNYNTLFKGIKIIYYKYYCYNYTNFGQGALRNKNTQKVKINKMKLRCENITGLIELLMKTWNRSWNSMFFPKWRKAKYRHPQKQILGETPIASYTGEMLHIDIFSADKKYFLALTNYQSFQMSNQLPPETLQTWKSRLKDYWYNQTKCEV